MVTPRDGDRVKAGDKVEFVVRIASNQTITKIELLIDDKAVAEGKAVEAPNATPATTPVLAKLSEYTHNHLTSGAITRRLSGSRRVRQPLPRQR